MKFLSFILSLPLLAQVGQVPVGIFGAPAAGGSAPTVVQNCVGNLNTSGNNTITCVFGSNITAGHRLWMCMTNNNSGTPTFSGDSDTFVADITAVVWDASARWATCATVASTTGGSTTITATLTGQINFSTLFGIEVAGSSGVDHSGSGTAGSGTSVTGESITNTNNNTLNLGVVFVSSTNTITVGSGWTTVVTQATAVRGNVEQQTQTTAGSITATWSINNGGNWLAHITSFKP